MTPDQKLLDVRLRLARVHQYIVASINALEAAGVEAPDPLTRALRHARWCVEDLRPDAARP
jgi:hypothetical protein